MIMAFSSVLTFEKFGFPLNIEYNSFLCNKKEKSLGGDCLHFGCVPSKTLISAPHAYHAIANAEAFGLPPVDVPPVDFAQIRDRIAGVIATIQKHDSEERFCGLGAKSKENIIGVQILGPNAGDLINEWVAGAYLSPKIFSLKGRACGTDME